MSGTLSPLAWQTFVDATGTPYSGGKLYTYTAGTSTLATTYSDVSLATPNANPIILDAAGRCVIFLAAASYKYVLYDSNDVLIKTQDNVASVGLSSATIGAAISVFGGDENVPITNTTYPSGTTWDTCAAGTSWLSIDSANLVGTFALEGMMQGVSGVTVTAALVNLTDGAPDTPLVTIASSSSTGERQVSGAITFAAAGASKTYAIKSIVSSGSGMIWNLFLKRLS